MTRRQHDFYPTPSWATQHMIDELPFSLSGTILEPCCGAGDIVGPVQHQTPAVFTCDIDHEHQPDLVADMTLRRSWKTAIEVIGTRPHWTITNLPFNAAHHILPLALEYSTEGVIALLRLSYQEPCENRAQWLSENQERQSILYLPRRVSFTGDGNTDNVATAWFIWGKSRRVAPPYIYPRVDSKQLVLGV
jgi:hypothetical protein